MIVAAIELFAGIGGFAEASEQWLTVLRAIDVNHLCRQVYTANHPARFDIRCIEGLTAEELAAHRETLWWLSPPCQPFTRRGKQGDIDDPRSAALRNLLKIIADVRPVALALENVPPFAESRAANMLRETLHRADYHWTEYVVCPTQFGIANRRRRFYLCAQRKNRAPLSSVTLEVPSLLPNEFENPHSESRFHPRVANEQGLGIGSQSRRSVAATMIPENSDDPSLLVPTNILRDYANAIDIVDPQDDSAVTACFTSAYGRSPVRSGSFVRDRLGIRYFCPREILRFLGFTRDFVLPSGLSRRQAWSLVGNSISVDVVRWLLKMTFSFDRRAAEKSHEASR